MDLLKIFTKNHFLILLCTSFFCAASVHAESEIPLTAFSSAPIAQGVPKFKESGRLLIYFWATWCPDCKSKLQGPLAKISEQTGSEVLLIATDKDLEKIQSFLKDLKVELPSIHDQSRELRKLFKAFSVPTWVVLERVGANYKILAQESGGDLDKILKFLKGG